jgi:hypothetical protein
MIIISQKTLSLSLINIYNTSDLQIANEASENVNPNIQMEPNVAELSASTPKKSSAPATKLAPISLVTPRREEAMKSSVPFTPAGDEANVYKYYCPLCMEHWKGVLKSRCCGNYACLRCTTDYLGSRGLVAESVNDILGCPLLKTVSCPHCFTTGFDPMIVAPNEVIRDYSMNGYKLAATGPNATLLSAPSSAQAPRKKFITTPVKIGDSFEELKRKMLPFQLAGAQVSKQQSPGVRKAQSIGVSPHKGNEFVATAASPSIARHLVVDKDSPLVDEAYGIAARTDRRARGGAAIADDMVVGDEAADVSARLGLSGREGLISCSLAASRSGSFAIIGVANDDPIGRDNYCALPTNEILLSVVDDNQRRIIADCLKEEEEKEAGAEHAAVTLSVPAQVAEIAVDDEVGRGHSAVQLQIQLPNHAEDGEVTDNFNLNFNVSSTETAEEEGTGSARRICLTTAYGSGLCSPMSFGQGRIASCVGSPVAVSHVSLGIVDEIFAQALTKVSTELSLKEEKKGISSTRDLVPLYELQ